MDEAITELFGEGVSEEEARALIRVGQMASTLLEPAALLADKRISSTARLVLADALEAWYAEARR